MYGLVHPNQCLGGTFLCLLSDAFLGVNERVLCTFSLSTKSFYMKNIPSKGEGILLIENTDTKIKHAFSLNLEDAKIPSLYNSAILNIVVHAKVACGLWLVATCQCWLEKGIKYQKRRDSSRAQLELRYVGVIWFVFHALQLLPIIFTQPNSWCIISKYIMEHLQSSD